MTPRSTDDIIDAEVVSRAAVLRQAAARKAKAGAVRAGTAAARGGGSLGRRYGRGLRNAAANWWDYWFDARGILEIEATEPGKRKEPEAAHEKRVIKNRAIFTWAVLSSASWCTGGLVEAHRIVPGGGGWASLACIYLVMLALPLVIASMVRAGKHKNGWLWPTSLFGVDGVTLAAVLVHRALDVSAVVMGLGWLGVLSAWFLVAGRDGNLFAFEDGAPARKADAVTTDTRYNRIVEGFARKLGLKEGGEQITVIGAGLAPVDHLWSRMRLQFPGTITNDLIRDAVPGVAAFLGISAERLDAVGVDDGSGGEIEGVVDVWLASGDQWGKPQPWPLLDAERVNAWQPVPFIVTDRGTPVLASLLFAAWMLVSKPRHGKTYAMRLLALAAALDPRFDLAAFDFKPGGRDWLWARPLAVASSYGNSDAAILALLEYLRSVVAGADERGGLFQALPEELVPHGQLTEAACEHEPRLRPLVISVDEVHHALMHPAYGKEITSLFGKIAREMPFIGVNTLIASQRADVKTSIPSQLRSLIANRVAGKLFTSRDSGDVLGDAANDLGYNAKNLRDVKGLFVVHGADDTSSFDGYTRGRAYLVDNLQATKIAQRAVELRRAAGVLPDQAAEPAPPPDELVQAIEILRADRVASMRSEELASRMGSTPQRLLGKIGVRSRQEPSDGYCKHVYLADLEAAAAGKPAGLRVVS